MTYCHFWLAGQYNVVVFYSVAVVGRNVNQQHIEEGHITSVLLVCIY